MPVCATPEERLFFQQFILDRIVVVRAGQSYHYIPKSAQASGELISECIERLTREGNMHLLGIGELPAILQARARAEALRSENAKLEAAKAEFESKTREEIVALRAARVKAEAVAEAAKAESAALRASNSWRITAPLRYVAKHLRG
jgi:hypothetical protein